MCALFVRRIKVLYRVFRGGVRGGERPPRGRFCYTTADDIDNGQQGGGIAALKCVCGSDTRPPVHPLMG